MHEIPKYMMYVHTYMYLFIGGFQIRGETTAVKLIYPPRAATLAIIDSPMAINTPPDTMPSFIIYAGTFFL